MDGSLNGFRRRPGRRVLTACLLLVMSLPASPAMVLAAAQSMEEHPGYFPIESFDVGALGEANVEINVPGSLLKLLGGLSASEQPDFGELVAGLVGVRVRVFEIDASHEGRSRDVVASMSKWLDGRGWDPIVKVRDEGEQVYIYSRTIEGELVGVSVVACDETELSVINLVGTIDLEQLGRVAGALDIDFDFNMSPPENSAPEKSVPEKSAPPESEQKP